jgi:hypothetical protein
VAIRRRIDTATMAYCACGCKGSVELREAQNEVNPTPHEQAHLAAVRDVLSRDRRLAPRRPHRRLDHCLTVNSHPPVASGASMASKSSRRPDLASQPLSTWSIAAIPSPSRSWPRASTGVREDCGERGAWTLSTEGGSYDSHTNTGLPRDLVTPAPSTEQRREMGATAGASEGQPPQRSGPPVARPS